MAHLTEAPQTAYLAQLWSKSPARRTLFESDDRDHAQAIVGRIFRPHRLAPKMTTSGRLSARMDCMPVGLIGISMLAYGARVDIVPGPLEEFYLLQIPLSGEALIRSGSATFLSDTRCASLLSPQPDLSMHWGADNRQLIVRIDARLIGRMVDAWCGERMPMPTFSPVVMLDLHAELLDIVASLIEVGGRECVQPGSATVSVSLLQQRLLSTLLRHQPHDQAHHFAGQAVPIVPRLIRRVEDYMIEHSDEPLTPDLLAQQAGVSTRSLFLSFQRCRGISPMRLLRELRLQRAHVDLLRAGPNLKVSDVAYQWGFYHLGRFAQEYRQTFGETPMQTLSVGQR